MTSCSLTGGGCSGKPPQLSGGPRGDQVPAERSQRPEGETRQVQALPGDSAADPRSLREGTSLSGRA